MTLSVVHLPDRVLERGETLRCGHVGYSLTGPAGAPVVLTLGGISAGRDPGFWPQFGPGRPVDPLRVRVLGVDWLGDGAGSRGPLPGERFPALTPRDQAEAVLAVLHALGIERLRVIGASYGGMVALALGALAPDRVERALVIGAAHRPHPRATAWRSIQRRLLDLAEQAGDPVAGVALARALAITTYQRSEGWDDRFRGAEVEGWLEHHGRRLAQRMSPESYRALSGSVDLHAIPPASVQVPVELVGLEPDELVPGWLVDELAAGLPRLVARHHVPTRFGHDGFLHEEQVIGAIVTRFLAGAP